MSNNINCDHSLYNRPPLPPKNAYKAGPPLFPKRNNLKDIKRENIITLPKKLEKPSKSLIINNDSYALSNIEDSFLIREEKVIEKKETYENYDSKIKESTHNKKHTIFNKIKNILKKNKRGSQSTIEETTNDSSMVTENNKYNEIPNEQFQSKCSNVCNHCMCNHCVLCCRTCYSFHFYHHSVCVNSFQNSFSHGHNHIHSHGHNHGLAHGHVHGHSHSHNHSHSHSHCCGIDQELIHGHEWDSISSFTNTYSKDKICGSDAIPIVPNRIRVESQENKPSQSQPVEFERKSLEQPKLNLFKKYSELKKVGWYWGSVNPDEADRVMMNRPDGTFFVRDSAHNDHLFSVTIRVDSLTYHVRIQFSKDGFRWNHNVQDEGFESIIDLIENSMEISRRGECRYFESSDNTDTSIPPYAVRLLYPLSRYSVMCSLKHLTRFIIVSNVRSDHLDKLPLPPHLRSYLHDKEHHFIENFDKYVNIIDKVDRESLE